VVIAGAVWQTVVAIGTIAIVAIFAIAHGVDGNVAYVAIVAVAGLGGYTMQQTSKSGGSEA